MRVSYLAGHSTQRQLLDRGGLLVLLVALHKYSEDVHALEPECRGQSLLACPPALGTTQIPPSPSGTHLTNLRAMGSPDSWPAVSSISWAQGAEETSEKPMLDRLMYSLSTLGPDPAGARMDNV